MYVTACFIGRIVYHAHTIIGMHVAPLHNVCEKVWLKCKISESSLLQNTYNANIYHFERT